MKKRITGIILSCMIALAIVSVPYSVKAITLAESFTGGTYFTRTRSGPGGNYYTKTSWANTYGYYGNHYLRAYVGGTSASPAGAWADTGRVYVYGNKYVNATTGEVLVPTGVSEKTKFPTAYAKYGLS